MIRRYLLPVGLILALFSGMLAPGAGLWLAHQRTTLLFVATIFLINGYQTDLRSLSISKRLIGAMILSGLVSFVIGGALGRGIATLLGFDSDITAGIVVMSVMAPTLSSVIVITQESNGNRAWAILLTVALNLLAIGLIPVALLMLLPARPGSSAKLPAEALFMDLVLGVLAPFILGAIVRHLAKLKPSRLFNMLPTLLVIVLSYMSFSSGREKLMTSTAGNIALLIGALLLLHGMLLAVAILLSSLFGYQVAERKAIAFISSQKTLPTAVAIIASLGYAGAAAVPCVVFHFSQILCDSIIASLWRQKGMADKAASDSHGSSTGIPMRSE